MSFDTINNRIAVSIESEESKKKCIVNNNR